MSALSFKTLVALSLVVTCFSAEAAIALDRTRAIIPGSEKGISMTISNENKEQPYLAQAWLENDKGEKISSPLLVVPPMQRVEPGKKSTIRINVLPAASTLPQDRESVFWFSVREVPPRSEHTNVLQVALQTRIKVFYRPAAILPEKFSRWDDQLVLNKVAGGFRIDNPTPYFMSVIALTGGEKEVVAKDFKPVMIAPKSSAIVKSNAFATPWITTINDFGGHPKIGFNCEGAVCHAIPPKSSN